jgi:WD40 repeat protein
MSRSGQQESRGFPSSRATQPRGLLVAALSTLLGAPCWSPGRADEPPKLTYEGDIKPLFARRCTICHRASKRGNAEISGGLALDSFEAVLAGTANEKVIVPGRSADSELVRRLAQADEDRRMPLLDEPLSKPEQELVKRWIDLGAPRGALVAPASATSHSQAGASKRLRSVRAGALDVVIATDVKFPSGAGNSATGEPLSIALAIGPLPAVTALAFRGDDRLLAAGSYGEVMLWDLHEGRPAGVLRDIPGAVHALSFSRDGRQLAVGAGLPARSGVVQVFAVPDGTLIHDFTGHDDVVYSLALRPDQAQLASASFDQTVRLWNLALGRPDGVFRGHSDFVYAVAYTRDGRAVMSAGKDRTIKRVSTRTLKEEHTYSGHDDDVLALAVHPDGKRFVSAGNEPQLKWWSFDVDKPQARRDGHSAPVQQLAFSASGRRLISAGGDGTVRLWDGQTGQPIRPLSGPTDWQYAAALSGDGRLAVAGGWDGLVRVWDVESGRLRAVLVQPPSTGASIDRETEPLSANWLVVSPTGHAAGSLDLIQKARWRVGTVRLPDQLAREVCFRPEAVASALRGKPPNAVSFSVSKGK